MFVIIGYVTYGSVCVFGLSVVIDSGFFVMLLFVSGYVWILVWYVILGDERLRLCECGVGIFAAL